MLSEIAYGAFGDVYLSRHVNSGAAYALKVISKQTLIEAFQDEFDWFLEPHIMESACRGQSPHIIKLIDQFEDVSNFYIVMEMAPLGDLAQVIRNDKRPMTEDAAKDVIWQLV